MTDIDILLYSLLVIGITQAVFALFAIIKKTDKLTDLSYGLTFIVNAWFFYFWVYKTRPIYDLVLVLLVSLWGLRLSLYLFMRILIIGKDKRFDGIREKPAKFIGFWILQILTIFLVSLPVTMYLVLGPEWRVTFISGTGLVMWLIGFFFESISDQQKFEFKDDPKNKGKFIKSGLWKYSRHPNYFGELMQWWGLFFFGAEFIGNLWLVTVIGPIFITVLILRVSGIPTLEKKYEERYKNDKEYQKYKKGTSILIPWFVKSK